MLQKNRDIFRIESYSYIINASKFPRNTFSYQNIFLQSDTSKLCLECFSNNMLVIFYIIDHLLLLQGLFNITIIAVVI